MVVFVTSRYGVLFDLCLDLNLVLWHAIIGSCTRNTEHVMSEDVP